MAVVAQPSAEAPLTRRAFDRGGPDRDLPRTIGTVMDDVRRRPDAPLRCVGCGNIVSHDAERISVNGAHEHQCVNPAEVSYRIGCFLDAPGVVEAGHAIARHSWFRGFSWRLALCRSCGGHLGWAFVGGGQTRFYGLILKRLTAEQ